MIIIRMPSLVIRWFCDDAVYVWGTLYTFLTVQKSKVCKEAGATSEHTKDERCPFHVNIGRYIKVHLIFYFFFEIHIWVEDDGKVNGA